MELEAEGASWWRLSLWNPVPGKLDLPAIDLQVTVTIRVQRKEIFLNSFNESMSGKCPLSRDSVLVTFQG